MSISAGFAAGAGADLAIGAGIGIAALAGARVPASLRCTTFPHLGFVPFDFNPTDITISRMSRSGIRASPGGGRGTTGSTSQTTKQVKGPDITLAKVIFEGATTKLRCDTLLGWMSPDAGFLGQLLALTGNNLKTQPPQLTFQWGPPMIGFMYTVKLTKCTVKYTRFTTAGIPVRAEVGLTMEEIPTLLGSLPQNPTSGGQAGRRRHTVAAGETLQSIATANYGNPGAWRRIAEVNGIQDAARVRPGTTVYLPNAHELRGA
ncbi:LysM peptidoglycan-binding domain-containing protein [Actinokineospora sp. NBRC 105648]|uniref:LysM peptidoglycan-binding domain-containing protein n=1 Tax=Actinokineospora sp. NBRC 105648 TaxID=3032206 RepID=UPI0024A4D8FF|nr:LysM peptidoglycan-binding domain-containing protein [Actinokineospora sp. NBRC 105648]GLZ39458.1 peptidase M23 [Actinokineospora sp. NBRC 105648]